MLTCVQAGVIGGLVGFPFTTHWTAAPGGLKNVAQIAAVANAAATGMRCLPIIMGYADSTAGITVVFIAQLIIGAVGPAVMVRQVF